MKPHSALVRYMRRDGICALYLLPAAALRELDNVRKPSAIDMSLQNELSSEFEQQVYIIIVQVFCKGRPRWLTQRLSRHSNPSVFDDSNHSDNDEINLREFIREIPTERLVPSVLSDSLGRPEKHKLVSFLINDPENPKNWSRRYKWYCTMVVAFTCFVVAFASSVVTADIEGVSNEFYVSSEVTLLTVTLFVVGFGIGMAFQF